MSLYKFATAIAFMLALSCSCNAKTWQTRGAGYWQDAGIWMSGIVPPYTSNDTFIINHAVVIDQSITLTSAANVLINANGGLCGHKNITVNAGSHLMKYGILEIDSLFIPGGNVYCRAPGNVILTDQGHIANGGLLDVNGCSLAVGPWFNCKLPEYNFVVPTSVLQTLLESNFSLSPNPNNGTFHLTGKWPGNEAIFELVDITGRTVSSQLLRGNSSEKWPVTTSVSSGFYYWQLRSNNELLGKGKVVITQ